MSPPSPSAHSAVARQRRGAAASRTTPDGAGPVDPATLGRWRARLDALTRWCLSDVPLTSAAVAVTALARPTLGELLRRALGRAGDGVVDLLDALDVPGDPAHRAQLARVLGADVLLAVITARGGAIVHAEARACRTAEEATTLIGAFLGGAVAPWVPAAGAHVRDAIASPLLAEPLDGSVLASPHAAFARLLADTSVESTLVLPLLRLDGEAAPGRLADVMLGMPDGDAAPTVFGGVLRPGSAFLDADAGALGLLGAPAAAPSAADATDTDVDADEEEDDEGEDTPAGLNADGLSEDEAMLADFAMLGGPAALLGTGTGVARPAADKAEEEDEPRMSPEGASAALERLRARQASVDRVPVVVTSDDGVAEHLCDAAQWLAEASEQELRALARGGWTGDSAVELALAADDPEVEDVARQARRHEAELVVEIDADAAVAWLRRHRPDTAERLEAVL